MARTSRRGVPDLSPAWTGLLELNPDGILVVSRGSGVEFANAAAERILGIDQASLQVMGFGARAWDARHPDGRPLRRREFPVLRALRSGRPVSNMEVDVRRPDGSRAVLSINVAPFRRDDEDVVVIGSVRDVTAQWHAETRRRLAWEMVRALAGSLDMDSTVETVAWLAIPALAEASVVQLLQKGRLQVVACRHVDSERQQMMDECCDRLPALGGTGAAHRVVATGQSLLLPDLSREGHLAAEEASLIRCMAFTAALFVPLRARGEMLGALTFYRTSGTFDAGDLSFAEELAGHAALAIDNARLFRDARASDRAKSDFISVMSHEFRTPLTAIVGYAELLGTGVSGTLSDQQRQQVKRIEIGAWHMTRLVDEVLSFSRIEAGRETIAFRSVDLAEAVSTAAELVRPMAEAKQLALRAEPPAHAVTLRTDPHLLRQILVNLLGNAVKFTSEGSVTARLVVTSGQVRVEVEDTGIGIAEEHVDRVFDSFWQVDQGTTRSAGGVGLGLTIARRLTELLGGTLTVASVPGRGSCFAVSLPHPGVGVDGAPEDIGRENGG